MEAYLLYCKVKSSQEGSPHGVGEPGVCVHTHGVTQHSRRQCWITGDVDGLFKMKVQFSVVDLHFLLDNGVHVTLKPGSEEVHIKVWGKSVC